MKLSVILLLISTSVLGAVHYLALEFYLYWQYVWFDVPMHILGGVVVALSLFAARDLGVSIPNAFFRLAPVLLFVMVVGILWEIFEVKAGLYMAENYVFDTAVDLCMDFVGGTVGFIVGSKLQSFNS